MAERKTKEKRQEEILKKTADILITSINAHIEDLPHTLKRVDDYILIAYVENSEGSYIKESDGKLDWNDPEKYGLQHFGIIIQDRDDKRFVPYLDVIIRVYDKGGDLITEAKAPFIWHPFVYHYGFDTPIENDGEYYIEVTVKSPKFDRAHRSLGKKYTEDLITRIGKVEIALPLEQDEMVA